MEQKNDTKTTSTLNEDSNNTGTSTNKTTSNNATSNNSTSNNTTDKYKFTNKINVDFDWNSEYGDGDIPNIDK